MPASQLISDSVLIFMCQDCARLTFVQLGQSLLLQTQADAKTIRELTQKTEEAARQIELLTQRAVRI